VEHAIVSHPVNPCSLPVCDGDVDTSRRMWLIKLEVTESGLDQVFEEDVRHC
jgi:hypothetical protein